MPRLYTGPKLWLDPARGTWTILDGRGTNVRTGFTADQKDQAEVAVRNYAEGRTFVPERPKAPRVHKTPPRRGVYVVGFDGYVKIGITVNVNERLMQLQTPVPVKLYALIDGWRREELNLHQRFARHRLKGEWFHLAGELAAWIDGGCK